MIFYFDIKKIYNFDPYYVFLAIATNIPQRLKTGFVGFVLHGHKCWNNEQFFFAVTNRLLLVKCYHFI